MPRVLPKSHSAESHSHSEDRRRRVRPHTVGRAATTVYAVRSTDQYTEMPVPMGAPWDPSSLSFYDSCFSNDY